MAKLDNTQGHGLAVVCQETKINMSTSHKRSIIVATRAVMSMLVPSRLPCPVECKARALFVYIVVSLEDAQLQER